MKKAILTAALLLLAQVTPARAATISLPKEVKVKPGRLFKLEAATDGKQVKWVNLHEDVDLIPDSSGKFAICLGAKPGQYKVAAYSWDEKGATDPAICLIVVEGERPPPAAPPPAQKADPVKATGKLRVGNAGCTATVIYPRRHDGRWDILSAAHCVRSSDTGTVTLKDGRVLKVKVKVRNTAADIAWLETDDATLADLPYAVLARKSPPSGTKIWHVGYGVDRPGNRETGVVVSGPDSNHMLRMTISVSSGDSGSAMFREDNGEVICTLYGTMSASGRTLTIGGGCERAWELRPGVSGKENGKEVVTPVPLPHIVSPASLARGRD